MYYLITKCCYVGKKFIPEGTLLKKKGNKYQEVDLLAKLDLTEALIKSNSREITLEHLQLLRPCKDYNLRTKVNSTTLDIAISKDIVGREVMVLVGGKKVYGTILWRGELYVPGTWFGVRFGEAVGDSNGAGKFYSKRGFSMFVPVDKLDFQVEPVMQSTNNYSHLSNTMFHKRDDGDSLSSNSSNGAINCYNVEKRVYVKYQNEKIKGVIKWLGTDPNTGENYAGIKLKKPKGNCEGTWEKDNMKHFNCKDGHGIYMPLTDIEAVRTETNDGRQVSGMSPRNDVTISEHYYETPTQSKQGFPVPSANQTPSEEVEKPPPSPVAAKPSSRVVEKAPSPFLERPTEEKPVELLKESEKPKPKHEHVVFKGEGSMFPPGGMDIKLAANIKQRKTRIVGRYQLAPVASRQTPAYTVLKLTQD